MPITQYHKAFERIKWWNDEKDKFQFTCKKCKFKLAYINPNDLSRKCAKCKSKESLTANTAFARIRIELNVAVELLMSIKQNYEQYEFTDRYREIGKPSGRDLAASFKMDSKTVWSFLNRVIDWLPKSFHKKSDADDSWFVGVRKENRLRHHALFNLLIEHREDDVLEILVCKKTYKK